MSVIVPTFQRREYVQRAVASVLAQTYQDFELIVVDDGSTDGTAEALADLDPRLRYVWQENRGTGAARNTGLRLARGNIVAFLDSDDRWLPHHLAVVKEVFEHFPQAVLVCTCPRQDIAGRQRPRDARLVDFLPLAYTDAWLGFICCTGIDRSELIAIGGFDERLEALEDNEIYFRLAARGPFALVQHRTMIHQLTDGSRNAAAAMNGTMLSSFETISRAAEDLARATHRPDRSDLLARAEGRMHYAAALRALVEGDGHRARRSLELACRLLPELSRRPEVVARRIAFVAASDRARCLALAAELWPDRRSDTAISLRLLAIAAGLRSGRAAEAVWLIARLPLASMPGFLVGNRSRWARLTRRVIRRRRSHAPASPTGGRW